MTTPDDPAALLAPTRERYITSETALKGNADAHIDSADDVPRLLAAVEAALKLADDWVNTPWPDDGGDRAGVATEQIIQDGIELRAAITAALTEGEGGNAQT